MQGQKGTWGRGNGSLLSLELARSQNPNKGMVASVNLPSVLWFLLFLQQSHPTEEVVEEGQERHVQRLLPWSTVDPRMTSLLPTREATEAAVCPFLLFHCFRGTACCWLYAECPPLCGLCGGRDWRRSSVFLRAVSRWPRGTSTPGSFYSLSDTVMANPSCRLDYILTQIVPKRLGTLVRNYSSLDHLRFGRPTLNLGHTL